MTDPLTRQAGYRIQAKIRELTDLMAAFTAEMNNKMTAADAAIANLNTVAATAATAIESSATDRAALHAQVDALGAAVAALPPSASPASVKTVSDALTALTARVAALEAKKLTARSAAAAIPLLAGSSTTVQITWPTPFPDATYVTGDPLVSAALLGKVTGNVQSQTATGCVVKLTGTAVSLGSTVTVDATRYA